MGLQLRLQSGHNFFLSLAGVVRGDGARRRIDVGVGGVGQPRTDVFLCMVESPCCDGLPDFSNLVGDEGFEPPTHSV